MNTNRPWAASIAAVAVAVLVAGCGSSEQDDVPGMHHGTPSASQPPDGNRQHNDADVAFAQGMVPHHTQALDMSRLAPERARSEQVKKLARQIAAAQGPEIDRLSEWLRGWGFDAPNDSTSSDMDHSGMRGMMPPEDMRQLRQSTGADFDRTFLTMMIEHHEGAVDMARNQLEQGRFPDARKMAQEIIDTQRSEIKTMRELLQQS